MACTARGGMAGLAQLVHRAQMLAISTSALPTLVADEPYWLEYGGWPYLVGDAACDRTAGELSLDARDWLGRVLDAVAVDEEVDRLAERGGLRIVVSGPPAERERAGTELALRCQRWEGRRNAASAGLGFGAALTSHRRLHDLDLPLVRADYRHALDVWQWTLRLDACATLSVQLAALYHDVERLRSERSARPDAAVSDYDDYKRSHAAASARIAGSVLAELALPRGGIGRAIELIGAHDGAVPPSDPEVALLEDADALSFLSLNVGGYLAWHGGRQTDRKIAWTLRRMSPRARAVLAGAPLEPRTAVRVRRIAAGVAARPREERR